MLRVMIAAILCAGAGAASAGSIEPFKATTSTRTSIVEVGLPILRARRQGEGR